jgi:GTP-binding protein
MKVTAARFVGAAATPGTEPPPGAPEVAVAGRSNVGKSSLINALVGQRSLARTSATPGRTRQINFFLLNQRLRLVDLPGYGFAVGSLAERRGWGPLVEGYLRSRSTLRGVIVLVDVRRGLEVEEHELLDFLAHVGRPAALVATKLDKLGRAAQAPALAALGRAAGGLPVIGFSARTRAGREEVWRILRSWCEGPDHPSRSARRNAAP